MLHDTELLQYVYKTADMGCYGIHSVIGHAQSAVLRNKLREQYKEYANLRCEARTQLATRGEPPKGIGPMTKASTRLMSTGSLLMNRTDSKIAEMTIQGNQMGVNKTTKHLNHAAGKNNSAHALAQKLLATEQANAEQLRQFL